MHTLKVTYKKGEEVRFISHLDHMRAIERAIRRADLPIAYSQGFNPRMKISYKTQALKVGQTSDACEAEFNFVDFITPQEVMDKLNATLPTGLRILNVDAA